ncbi:MAG TPA: hypothetical protein VGQ83_24450 [Polyangia bacterium]
MTTSDLTATPPGDWKVDQVIAFDWYDGARAGFCRLRSPRIEFAFELLAERPTEDGLDDRLFTIRVLPDGTVAAMLLRLAFAGAPASPVWAPRWETSNPGELESAGRAIEQACDQAAPTNLVIRTSDFVAFSGCWDVGDRRGVSDWFAALGLGAADECG